MEGAHVPDRRDAVTHPQLVHVVHRHALTVLDRVLVRMHVDEAGQQVFAVEVDLACAGSRPGLGSDGHTRVSNRPDVGDAIAFHNHVHRAERRCTRPVDDRRPPQDQAVVGSLALVGRAVGRSLGGLGRGRERHETHQ